MYFFAEIEEQEGVPECAERIGRCPQGEREGEQRRGRRGGRTGTLTRHRGCLFRLKRGNSET